MYLMEQYRRALNSSLNSDFTPEERLEYAVKAEKFRQHVQLYLNRVDDNVFSFPNNRKKGKT